MARLSQLDFDQVAQAIRHIAIDDVLEHFRSEIEAAHPRYLDDAQRNELIDLVDRQQRRIDADIRKATRSIRVLICPNQKPRQLELFS